MAIGRAPDIDGIKPQMRAAGRRDPDQRPQELRVARNNDRRQSTLAHQIGRAIGIGEHRLEQFRALDESGLERLPLRRVDQERQVAQRPGPLGP